MAARSPVYYGTSLSEHISRTPEGFLIAHDAVLCRTAENDPMMYLGAEVGAGTDDVVCVYRSAKEVFSPKHLASLEGKPVCDTHPARFVDVQNASWSAKGHVQNVRRGDTLPNGEGCLIGDIVVTDATLAEKVLDGHARQVSTGYSCEYIPRRDGSYEQRKLRANHVAIVPNGRAGEHVRIYDSAAIGSFAEIARELREQKAEDRLSEALLRGEPHSWDELALIVNGEENMGKQLSTEERSALVEGIVARLDRIVEKLNPVELEDEHPALSHLRALKPFVQASGDLKVIDAYNTAIRALKQQSHRVLQADTSRLANATSWRRLNAELNSDRSFEEAARRAGARMRGEDGAREESSRNVRALDGRNAEDWVAAQREAGRKMREKKY